MPICVRGCFEKCRDHRICRPPRRGTRNAFPECNQIRHDSSLVLGSDCMWSKRRVLSAIVGFSVLGISPGAIASIHVHPAATQAVILSQATLQHSRIVLADWDEYHHRRHHHHPPYTPYPNLDSNDYNWGGRYCYQYPPAWFGGPPSGWEMSQRRAYLEQRRDVAINMQQQMLARGDVNAAQRLGSVIGQLNRELGYR